MKIYYSGEAGQDWANPEIVLKKPPAVMFTYAHVNIGIRMRKRFFRILKRRGKRK